MKHNMGSVDRLLRAFVIAPASIVLSLTVLGIGSVLGIVALVVTGIALATAAVGFCPAYTLFGISTQGGISTHGHVPFGGRAVATATSDSRRGPSRRRGVMGRCDEY